MVLGPKSFKVVSSDSKKHMNGTIDIRGNTVKNTVKNFGSDLNQKVTDISLKGDSASTYRPRSHISVQKLRNVRICVQ